MSFTFTEEDLQNRKAMFLITLDQSKKEVDEILKDIFEKSFKLGISWEMENHDEFLLFKKTNI